MIDWDFLIDEADIASVLPEAYARYWRPIKRALSVFLEGLAAAHQDAILKDQATLQPTATVSERVARVARSCPTLHKLGQTLARDRRLSPELRLRLQQLESLPPSVSSHEIEHILTRELGPLDRLGIAVEPPALAEASVAVVVPFRWGQNEGVFKVLKPGIEERLEQELALLGRVASYLDDECEALGIPRLAYRDIFEDLAKRLRQEVRLDVEQRYLVLARATYANNPHIQIPALFPFCTPRVTAMERVYGDKVTDCHFHGDADRRARAELVVASLIARPVFSAGDAALFHGDPHAGNLLFTRDRRLAILDWSLATTFEEARRVAFIQIVLGAVTLDASRVARALAALCEQPNFESDTVMPVIHAALGRVRKLKLPGFLWLTELLDNAVQAGMRFDAKMLVMRKMLHMLEGVIADIGADRTCIDAVLLSGFFSQMAIEWPYRWLTPPDSREFVTRLSSLDLAGAIMRIPLTAIRFWLEFAADHAGER
jgi:ubiquinone biosynthesis protein